MIAITDNKLFKIQVRGSGVNYNMGSNEELIVFNLVKNNFRTLTNESYKDNEVDIFALYDMKRERLHLIKYEDVKNARSITIRYDVPRKRNGKKITFAKDTEVSDKRIKEIFDFDVPDFKNYMSKMSEKTIRKYTHTCHVCKKEFIKGAKKAKFCGVECSRINQRRVERPTKEQLEIDIQRLPMIHIGAKYGVSDNAVRKWAETYGIPTGKN
jgi:hypothetical protein